MRRLRTHLATTFCAALAALGAAWVPAAQAALPSQSVTAQAAVPGAVDTSEDPLAASVDPDPTLSAGTAAPSAFAPLAAAPASGPMPSILAGLNQPGLGSTYGEYPPDQGGAIGPDYYVQGVNTGGIAVYRRSDLAQVTGPILLEDFSAAPAGQVVVDTQIIWDRETSRWYYSFTYKHDGNPRTSGLLYGWSKTSDPTDLEHGWCQMRIDTGADFEDRPKLGDSAGYLIMTTNVDPIGAGYYDHVWTIPKPASGSTTCPASQTGIKSFGSRTQPLKTSDGDVVDSAIPATDNVGSTTGYVMSADDRTASSNQLMLWHVTANGDLVADGNVAVSPFTDPPLAAQPSPYAGLDTIDRRLGSAVAERDPDAGATAIWTQHTIADPAGTGRSIVRWYEILPGSCAPLSGTTCNSAARRQQGELKDPANSLFNAALSPTHSGNEAVIHYNVAGSGQLAQVRARSRVSNTPLGSFGDETTIETSDAADKDFTCADSRPGCRWGDYSAISADPSDAHVVWGSSQAIGPQNGTQPHWKTRNFALQATGAPSLVLSGTGTTDGSPGGDADGVVEPGESIDLSETVRNAGSAPASGISSTLSSNTAGLSITSAGSPYPDIATGGTGTNSSPFRASVSSAIACGAPLATTLSLQTSQGSYRVPISIQTGAAGPAQSTTATDVPKTIPDGNATGVTSSVSLTGSGRVADMNVSISRITHTFDGDLRIELIGPDGTSVVLADRPGGVENPGDNFVNTVFDDEAGTSLAAGGAPYTGSFRPQGGRLSVFDGKQIQGTWTLRVSDMSNHDTGRLEGWGTRVAVAACDVSSNTPPSAGFSVAPDPAPTGQAITFTSTSSDPDGTVASQAWDTDDDGQFDDGSGTTATKTYDKPGSYTVKLRVVDDRGASSIASRIVTVTNRPPVASFTASPDPALTAQTVTFSSTSTDPDGSIAAYAWDLDGNGIWDPAVSGATASRAFPKAGSYTVKLRVTDELGQTAETTRTVTVDNRAPKAGFGVAPAAPISGQDVTFTSIATDEDGTIAAYAWDLDNDGSWDPGVTGATASRQFANAGTYTVRLRVTDDNGATDTKSATVTVANRAPTAGFGIAPSSPVTGQAVTFTSVSSDPDGTIASQAWDLDGDGQYDDGTDLTASRQFAKAGPHVVGLRVTDVDGGVSTAVHVVTVAGRRPSASFTVDPQSVKPGEPSHFDAAASGDPDGSVVRYEWDLDGNGTYETDTGSSPATGRFYADPGNVIVRLRVTDDDGLTGTTERTVTVTAPSPFAEDPTERPPDGEPLPGVGPNPGAPPDPGLPAGKSAAPEPPRGALRLVGRRLGDALARGLAMRYSSSQAVTVQLRATVSARAARRFGGVTRARKPVVIGRARRLAGAGRASMRLKLFRRKRAHSAAAALPVTVKMTLIGATGLRRSYTAKVVLRG